MALIGRLGNDWFINLYPPEYSFTELFLSFRIFKDGSHRGIEWFGLLHLIYLIFNGTHPELPYQQHHILFPGVSRSIF